MSGWVVGDSALQCSGMRAHSLICKGRVVAWGAGYGEASDCSEGHLDMLRCFWMFLCTLVLCERCGLYGLEAEVVCRILLARVHANDDGF